MTVDFETHLRTEFASLPVDIPVDVEATLAAGRRARGRRISAAIGVVAVLAVVAVFTLPSMLQTSIPAVPDPMGTSAEVTFEGVGNPSPESVEHATLTIERRSGGLKIGVIVNLESGLVLRERFTHPDDGSTWLAALGERVWVAIVPDEVEWIIPVYHGSGWAMDDQSVVGMDLTAKLMVADAPGGVIDGLIWKRPDGTAWNSLGNEISIMQHAGASSSDVYADPVLDTIGLWTADGGMAKSLSEVGPDLLVQSGALGRRAGVWEFRTLFLLPEGDYADDGPNPEVSVSDEVSSVRSVVGPLVRGSLDGRYVAVVGYSAPATPALEGASLIESLSYTTPDGRRVTVVPGVGEVNR